MEFIQLLRILGRRRRLFAIIFASFLIAVILATELATPMYKARVKVLLYKGNSAMQAAIQGLGFTSMSAQVLQADSASETMDTDVELAITKPIVDELIESLDIRDSGGERVDYEDITTGFLVKIFMPQPHVSTDQFQDAGMIELVAYSRDAEQAAKMANKLSEIFNRRSIERLKEEYAKARLFVDDQIDEVMKRYQESLLAQRDFRVRELAISTTTQTTNILTIMNSIMEKLDQNERDRAVNAEKLSIAKRRIEQVNPLWNSNEVLATNSDASSLRAQVMSLMVQMQERAQTITPEHEDYKTMEAKLQKLKDLLASQSDLTVTERTYTLDPQFEDVYKSIISLTLELDASELRSTALRNDYQRYMERLKAIPDKEMQQAKYTVDADVNQALYNKLMTYRNMLVVAERISASNVQVVESASTPTNRYLPRRKINYAFGLLMGMALAFAGVLLAEYMDKSLKEPSDMKALGLPHLGSVLMDAAGPGEAAGRTPGLVLGMKRGSAVEESARAACGSALREARISDARAIAICSSMPSEGKSVTAANLAYYANRAGGRVLLVDMNHANPSLGGLFGLAGGGMLADYHGGADLGHCVKSPSDGISLLYGAQGLDDPALAVDSGLVRRIVSDAMGVYDLVIVDTPALMERNDAAVIAAQCSGAILVMEAGLCTSGLAAQAVGRIEGFGAKVIGAVLNKFSGRGLLHDSESFDLAGLLPAALGDRIKTKLARR